MRTHALNGLVRGFLAAGMCCFILAAQAADIGRLWKVEPPGGKPSYLFGTMHSDDPRINTFSPKLESALSASEVFMMETLPPDDQSLYFMQDATLRELLNKNELAQVHKLADFHSIQDEVALRMKPWLLAMVFDLPKPQSPLAQDVQLLALAQQQGKRILGLETAEEHFGVLDSLTREEQLTMLRSVLKRSSEEKERDFERLLKIYLAGNLDRIAAFDQEMTGNALPAGLWQKMRDKLIDERNARMAERIIGEAGKRSLFVAVGASHLAGERGLLSLLRQVGYKVSAY